MKKILICFIILSHLPSVAGVKDRRPTYTAQTIKVAVIDTGFDFKSEWPNLGKDSDGIQLRKPKLCNFGHKDFTGSGLQDDVGHGTHVAGIIAKFAEDADYCIVVIKFFGSNEVGEDHVMFSSEALRYAANLDVDIVNYSGGGTSFDFGEYMATKKLLDKGIILVGAAGNNSSVNNFRLNKVETVYDRQSSKEKAVFEYKLFFIDPITNEIRNSDPSAFYPAAYDARAISVSNAFSDQKDSKLHPTSNRGNAVSFQERGVNVLSLMPDNSVGVMTGTSQAAPTKTGKIIKMWGSK